MKSVSPKIIALKVSLLIALLFATSSIIVFLIFNSLRIIPSIITIILLFTFTYFTLKITLEKFIYDKIKLIYKTIYNLKRQKGSRAEKRNEDFTSLEKVNQEVLEWGENKKTEIEELKKNENYRRDFLGNIYHELKTPIFNIQGYVLTLLDGGLEDETINREYLLRTEKSINRMIAIVDDLETISNLETSQIILNIKNFDIIELTRDVFEFLEIKAKKKKKEFFFDQQDLNPIIVAADKKRIRQVLINLLDNSIKYGAPKQGKTSIQFYDMDEHILVEITDNGAGIAPEEIPRIFERFYRTNSARNMEKTGTGLGLAIVKHIIEAHEQTINVRSRLGVGTTFAFTLTKGFVSEH